MKCEELHMKHTIRVLIILVLVDGLYGCVAPLKEYSAKSIEAWVVDEETGKPLEGVVALAVWEITGSGRGPSFSPGNSGAPLQVLETVTDKNGRFYFPAWGPRSTRGSLGGGDDPRIYLLKEWYVFKTISNSFDMSREKLHEPVRGFVYNGKTVPLPKAPEDIEKYADSIRFLSDQLWHLRYWKDKCPQEIFPEMLAKVSYMKDDLAKLATQPHVRSIINSIYKIDRYLDDPSMQKCINFPTIK
jgi:hypothetical protein